MTRVIPSLMIALLLMIAVTALYFAYAPDDVAQAPVQPPGGYAMQGLNATLWVQTAAEYRAIALQTYRLAQAQLRRALQDPAWHAVSAEGTSPAGEPLPPAVILDLDETVFDNSPYQARQILDDAEFQRDTWQAWVREQKAAAIPGALDFTRWAVAQGVAVYYVTNRRHEVEDATRDNLARLGFPLVADRDTILTPGENGWTSDKQARRTEVARQHRVLLLIGDNLGDFLSQVNRSRAEREQMIRNNRERWGREWIVLPNPEYGSWEGSLIDYSYGLPRDEKLQRKLHELNAAR